MNRLLTAAALCVLALSLPVSAYAASPSPSPGLDKVIAPPPTGFTELTTATLHGQFTAHDWAVNASGATPTETENTLNRFGFVDGYGKEWSNATLRRALIEAVMAFNGGSGAKKALTALESTDKADANYKHSDSTTGIGTYYGAHFTASGAFEDEFVFLKGNDLFIVIMAGAQDNVLTPAVNQAKTQYDSAPAGTIPTSQWPENRQSSTSSGLGSAVGLILPIIIVLAIIAVVVGVIRRRQRPPAMAMGTYAPPSMSATGEVQMSPDGNFWWDGQTWRDAAHEAPSTAQRSDDGSLWWDGRTWRPVPGAQPPSQPQAPPQ